MFALRHAPFKFKTFVLSEELAPLLKKSAKALERLAVQQGWEAKHGPNGETVYFIDTMPPAMQRRLFEAFVAADNAERDLKAIVYDEFIWVSGNMNVFYCENIPRRYKHVFNAALYSRCMEICEDAEGIFRSMDFRTLARLLLKHVPGIDLSLMLRMYEGHTLYSPLRDTEQTFWLYTIAEIFMDMERRQNGSLETDEKTFCTIDSENMYLPAIHAVNPYDLDPKMRNQAPLYQIEATVTSETDLMQ